MTDFGPIPVSDPEHTDSSDDEFVMAHVMDDISVTCVANTCARPVADSALRSGSNPSPVCVAGVFDSFSFENPVDRDDDGDHLGKGWDGNIANDVSMDSGDDDDIPLPVEDFVNFDNFDDAILRLCDPTMSQADQPPGMYLVTPPPTKARKKITKKISKIKKITRKTKSKATKAEPKAKLVKRSTKSKKTKKVIVRRVVSSRSIKLHKIKRENVFLSPPVTPVGSAMDLVTPRAPIPVQRCLFMPAFDERSLSPIPIQPRSMPDENWSAVDDGDLLPFHPVCNKPAIVKVEQEDLDTKPAAAKTSKADEPVDEPKADVPAISVRDKTFDSYLPALMKFVQEHGHCAIPYKYDAEPRLSGWVKRQRYQYKLYLAIQAGDRRMTTSLTPQRVRLLDSIGFCWNLQELGWEIMFKELQAFVKENGHTMVPKKVPKLGRWVGAQRTQLRTGKMKVEHFMKLESVGFEFWCCKSQETVDAWHDMKEKVAQWKQEAFMKSVEEADAESGTPL
ncbi:MAG: hypothetical protein SGARI_003877 [Bacillariaceae sp.]